ncbi:MAG: DNA polymerase III subunit gamma/tau, partial [Thermoleophilia bacterium]|nr:DNA polymerase III subunit gamma/tau [Thermoleophilia bacterium]
MSSLALYRKYRPQRFDDVVGQTAVVRTLQNAIREDKVAHAYLFTGPKGTGKTTMAKLLAKAMNCEQGPTVNPCGVCESCVAIAEGRSMDVAEIDAASNRGIDDVREKIIDTDALRPSSGARRIYILDEAHQLTNQAFNALLKTIEEPPDHVLFAFCTTEQHEMMPTVRDRCQRMVLSVASIDELVDVLQRVIAAEKITADEPALRAVARVAQGSFRNALGTLEMMATAFGQTFTHADVLTHLGAVSEDTLYGIADGLVDSNPGAVLAQVEALAVQGGNIEQFSRELAEHLRIVLLAKHGVASAMLGTGDPERLAAQAARADERVLLSGPDCISDAQTRIRVGTDPRIAVETALVRACQGLGLPSLALRLATIEHKLEGGYGKPLEGGAASAASGGTHVAAPVVAPPIAAPVASAAPAAAPVAAPQAAAGPIAELVNTAAWWPQFLTAVSADGPLRAVVQGIELVGVEGEKLTVSVPSTASLFTDTVKARLGKHVARLTGTTPRLEVHDGAVVAAGIADTTARSRAAADKASDDDIDLNEVDDAPAESELASRDVADDGGAGMAMFA